MGNKMVKTAMQIWLAELLDSHRNGKMTIDELARASNALTEYTREQMDKGWRFPREWHDKLEWVQEYVVNEIGIRNVEHADMTTAGLIITLKPEK